MTSVTLTPAAWAREAERLGMMVARAERMSDWPQVKSLRKQRLAALALCQREG